MFIKDTLNNNGLAFIKSKNVKAFPCSRRRSELVDTDGNDNTISDRYYIPFDPEARLNTEANSRKHSALNGYKQTYLRDWLSNGIISFVIAGYLFIIDVGEENGKSSDDLGKALTAAEVLNNSEATAIYANVKLASITFFSGSGGTPQADTEILRDQSTSKDPRTYLDLLKPGGSKTNVEDYYFYGLSFSTNRLDEGDSDFVSLPLLIKVNNEWKIPETSRLPKIDHGETENSIEVGTIYADKIYADEIRQNGRLTVSLDLVEVEEDKYQLQFYNADIKKLTKEQ